MSFWRSPTTSPTEPTFSPSEPKIAVPLSRVIQETGTSLFAMAADTRRMSRIAIALVAVILSLGGCTGDVDPPAESPAATGPDEVELATVQEHARQFDDELPERPAGSQEEFAAASYITGHLQQAGYEVMLTSVPFKDLVRSTNVVALPPGGGPIDAVVTVLYDTTGSTPPYGVDIGLFLEIARAARVVEPDHNVQFVALGAEVTTQGGGNLGSRQLASELADLDPKPPVIGLLEVPGGGFKAPGPAGDDLNRVALEMDLPDARPLSEPLIPAYLRASQVFSSAGVPHAIAAGGIEEIGRVVLAYLGSR